MILEEIPRFIRRLSDLVHLGRNGARIVLGTDRKDTITSGYGDGSENASTGAGAIDIVAGYREENVNFDSDSSRIYLSAKSNPDEYLQMELGDAQEETPSILLRTDQFYIKTRQFIKIKNPKVSILINPNGDLTIEAEGNTKIKSGNSVLQMNKDGSINVGAESGTERRILTEEDVCVGIDPTTGSPILSRFTTGIGVNHPQGGVVQNSKVKVVG